MLGLQTLLASLLAYVIFIYAASLRTNGTGLSLPHGRTPIPDFEVRVRLAPGSNLDAQAVIAHGVELMARIADLDYEMIIEEGITMRSHYFPEEIVIGLLPPTASTLLRIKHAVQALYEACAAVSTRLGVHEGFVPGVFAELYLKGVRRGYLTIRHQTTASNSANQISTSKLAFRYSETENLSRTTMDKTLSAHEGMVIDPLDPHGLVVTWVRRGKPVDGIDLWTASLDALATSAQYDKDDFGARVTGIGISKRSEIDFHAIIPRQGPVKTFRWGQLVRVIRLIWLKKVVWTRSDRSIDFTVYYQDEAVAVGDAAPYREWIKAA
ncbi:MAG: hypothetical protein Q9209_005491 [Squamulea sp. 1 TL-2023]